MRISTEQFFKSAITNIQNGSDQLSETQQKIARGVRILTPSDDPVANAKVVQIQERISITDQYQSNVVVAEGRNEISDNVLNSIDQALQRLRELAIQANSGAVSDDNRRLIASEMRIVMGNLQDLMNTRDGLGGYLYGGFQTDQPPFVERTSGGFDFLGDEGENALQVSSSSRVQIGDSGKNLFVDVRSSSNTVIAKASVNNSSTPGSSISAGTVVDPNKFDLVFPENFVITFNDPQINQNRMTYSVTQLSDGAPVMGTQPPGFLVNVPYEEGGRIEFHGVEFFITGEPQFGDTFIVESTGNQSILNMVDRFARILETTSANDVTLPTQTEVIGRASPGKPNVNTAGNYVAAQAVSVRGPNNSVQTLSINANETGANIATQLSALVGVTAVANPTQSTLDFRNSTLLEGETISFSLNGAIVNAVAGSTAGATYTNIDTALTAALAALPSLSHVNNGNGTFTFTDTAGNDISVEDFAVVDIPRVDLDVLGGFNAGDTVQFTLVGSAGETVNVNYAVATGTVDEFLTQVQADITAQGVAASFSLVQSGGAGSPITLRYLGDTNGNANVQINGFQDGGANNAQLTVTPSTGTLATNQTDGSNVSIISNGANYALVAEESRATVQYQGSLGDPVTLLEGLGDSSSVASRVSISLTPGYSVSSTVESGNGGIVMQEPNIEEVSRNRFLEAVDIFLVDIDNAQENVIRSRAEIGARLNTLREVEDSNEGIIIELKTFLSDLRDLDYAEALTNLNLESFIVEAAQASFVRISQLSLFRLLS